MAFDPSKLTISSDMGSLDYLALLPQVHSGVMEVLNTYLDLDPDEKSVIANWIMAAAYKDAFYATPELFVNASKASGKTRLLKLISSLLPGSIMVVSMSESSLFRLCEVKRCILIDEAENMSGKEKANLRDMLNVCYKRGGVVPRVEKVNKKGGDKYEVKEYPVYIPVVLANVWGLDSVLEDKCITIILEKSTDPRIINMPEFFDRDPRIKAIRTFFECSVDYVGSHLENAIGANVYRELDILYNTYIHTLYTQSYIDSEVKEFSRSVYDLGLDGRTLELWMPLFLVSYTTDPQSYTTFLEIAKRRIKSKQSDELTGDRDTSVAVSIYSFLKPPDTSMETKHFIDAYLSEYGEQHWLTSEWLGRFLKRAKIIMQKVRTGRGYRYDVNMAALKKYLQARHALEESQKPELVVGQSKMASPSAQVTTLTPTIVTDRPKPVPMSGAQGICPVCGKSTSKLWEWSDKWMCTDCLPKNADLSSE